MYFSLEEMRSAEYRKRISWHLKKSSFLRYRTYLVLASFLLITVGWICFGNLQETGQVIRNSLQDKHVYIIARSYGGMPKRELLAFSYSILAQTHQNFTLWIVNGEDPSNTIFSKEVSKIGDDRITSLAFSFKKGTSFFHSYGYYTTDLAIQKIIAETLPGDNNQYLLITNADNLYNHLFLETSLKLFEKETCLVASDWISRYIHTHKNHVHPNQPDKIQWNLGGIDLGCAVSSVAHIRRAFPSGKYFQKGIAEADWYFFRKLLNVSGNICGKKTHQILFTHQ